MIIINGEYVRVEENKAKFTPGYLWFYVKCQRVWMVFYLDKKSLKRKSKWIVIDQSVIIVQDNN